MKQGSYVYCILLKILKFDGYQWHLLSALQEHIQNLVEFVAKVHRCFLEHSRTPYLIGWMKIAFVATGCRDLPDLTLHI